MREAEYFKEWEKQEDQVNGFVSFFNPQEMFLYVYSSQTLTYIRYAFNVLFCC